LNRIYLHDLRKCYRLKSPRHCIGYLRRQRQARAVPYIRSVYRRVGSITNCEEEAALTWPILFQTGKLVPRVLSAESSRVSFHSFPDIRIYSVSPTGIFLSRKRISLGIAESRCWLSNPSLDPVPRAERRINNIDIAIGGSNRFPPTPRRPIPELNVVMRDNRMEDVVLQLDFTGSIRY